MSWQDVYVEHGRWWTARHADEPALLPALGMLKALRNFVHPLLKAKQMDTRGVDNRPAAVEAIGDMLMYSCALYRSMDMALFVEPRPQKFVTAELGVSGVCFQVHLVIDAAVVGTVPLQYRIMELVNAVTGLAGVCCIDSFEAAAVSLAKLRTK